jgi:hypothetical protein
MILQMNSLEMRSGWGLRLNILSCGFHSHPGDHYYVPVSGQLAEKLSDPQGLEDTIGR